jgi:GDP-L-fucose synthase
MRGKILVTGGGGLLGYGLGKLCPEANFVTSRDFDLRDSAQVEALFDRYQPERVLHLAAHVGGVKKNALHNADLYTDNVLINTNVLNQAQKRGVKRLISVLSSCAYPHFDDRPSTENDLHTGLPFKGNLGYGMSKRLLDLQTHLLNEQYACQFSTITPMTMFGPNDDWDLEGGHVVASLIHKCFLAKQHGKALEVWGSGRAVRQFIYSYDVARILMGLLDQWESPQTLILAPDQGITIGDLAHTVARAFDFKGPVLFDTSKPEGQLKRSLQSNQAKTFQYTPFEVALKETVQWFTQHSENQYAKSV